MADERGATASGAVPSADSVAEPAGYPSQLVESARLPDGTPLQVRPIRPNDLELERDFIAALSSQTGYQRLMSARRPPPEELWRFTHIDYDHELALVACAQIDGRPRMLGVARFVRDSTGRDADFAIVVADAWQGRGLGALLLDRLVRAARTFGAQQLSGITMSSNTRMLALAKRLGFEVARDRQDATVTNLRLAL